MRALANHLADFFGDRIDQHISEGLDPAPGADVLGFMVGGYAEGTGRTYEVLLPSRTVEALNDTSTNTGSAWRGQTGVIARLIKGIDWETLPALLDSPERITQVEGLTELFSGLEYIIPFESMNLQGAVDFAVLAIRTTIDVQRLTHGVRGIPGSWPGVGGPIEIAVVTPAEGFRWLQRTDLQGERGAGEAESI